MSNEMQLTEQEEQRAKSFFELLIQIDQRLMSEKKLKEVGGS